MIKYGTHCPQVQCVVLKYSALSTVLNLLYSSTVAVLEDLRTVKKPTSLFFVN